MLVVNPRPPKERLVPRLLKFSRMPGAIFNDLRNRKPMRLNSNPGRVFQAFNPDVAALLARGNLIA
jgi:hypothetical protein